MHAVGFAPHRSPAASNPDRRPVLFGELQSTKDGRADMISLRKASSPQVLRRLCGRTSVGRNALLSRHSVSPDHIHARETDIFHQDSIATESR